MKTAIIILSSVPRNTNPEQYLSVCANKVRKDGCSIIHSVNWSDYRDINNIEFINKIAPVTDIIYLFVDFGANRLMIDLINKYYDRNNLWGKFKKEIRICISARIGRFTLNNVLEDVSNRLGVSIDMMKSKTRERETTDARHIYFYRARLLTSFSLELIGKQVNRDHASVLHGIANVLNIKQLNDKYNLRYGNILRHKKTEELVILDESKKIIEPRPVYLAPFSNIEKHSDKPVMEFQNLIR